MTNSQKCSHFWLGRFTTEQHALDYFAEVWDDNDEDREYTPLSAFAHDQGEKWYDHDYLEYVFSVDTVSVSALLTGLSYADQYHDQVCQRATETRLTRCNVAVLIEESQIERPRSAQGGEYALHYLGTITYRV